MAKLKDGSISVSISMPASEDELLEAACIMFGTNKSAFVREAIHEKLSRHLASDYQYRKRMREEVMARVYPEE